MQKATNDPLPFCFCLSSLVLVLVAPPRRVARHSLRLYYIYFGPPSPFALMAQTEQNHWINKSLAEEWPARERRRGRGGNGRFFAVIRGPYVSNLRALCTLAENRGFMIDGGVKISPRPWRRTQASTRKLLSADSFISVDIYQVNYPCSLQMFTTTSTASRRTCQCARASGCVLEFCCVPLATPPPPKSIHT